MCIEYLNTGSGAAQLSRSYTGNPNTHASASDLGGKNWGFALPMHPHLMVGGWVGQVMLDVVPGLACVHIRWAHDRFLR